MGVSKHPLFFGANAGSSVSTDIELARRLRQSFTALAARGNEVAERFYARLFAGNPELRPLFPSDMAAQHQKLVHTLASVVESFETPARNAEMLGEIGRRHSGYGARPEHYALVEKALLAAMGETAGASWNSELELDWRTALAQISAAMIQSTRTGVRQHIVDDA